MVKPKLTNLLVLGGGEIATRGFSFLAFSYLGHNLAPEDMGLYGSALAVLMFGMLSIDQGLGIHGSRGIARNPADTNSLVRRIVSVQVWLSTGVYGLIWLSTAILPLDPTLVILLRGLGLALFGAPFLLNWVFQGHNEMFWYAIPMATRQLVFLIIVLLLVRGPDDLTKLPLAEIGGVALASLIFVQAYRKKGFEFAIDLKSSWDRELFKEALPIGASNLIWALRTYLPILIVLGTLGSHDAGLFEPGHRIIMVFLAFLGVYFTNSFPAMSAAAVHAPQELWVLIRSTLKMSVLACMIGALAVTWASKLLIGLVVGQEYITTESLRSMVLLAWLLPVVACRRCAMNGLIVLNHQASEFRCSLGGLMLLVVLLIPMTSHFGLGGCSSSILIAEVFATAITWMSFNRLAKKYGIKG